MLEIYKQCLFNRYFEYKVAEAIDKGLITCPTYLSVGSEFIPALLRRALKELGISKCNIFAQHRCHSYFLSFIEKPLELALELCGSSLGCNKGMGGSASIAGENNGWKLIGHDGLLGSQIPIAAGFALASQEPTICILGDGASEEDYCFGTLSYLSNRSAPILFICEDNDLSILTKKKERRDFDILDVADSFNLNIRNIHHYHLIDRFNALKSEINHCFKSNSASFLNIEVCRHFWHAGSGRDGPPKYDYLDEFETQISVIYEKEYSISYLKYEQQEKVNNIWKQLETQLKN